MKFKNIEVKFTSIMMNRKTFWDKNNDMWIEFTPHTFEYISTGKIMSHKNMIELVKKMQHSKHLRMWVDNNVLNVVRK